MLNEYLPIWPSHLHESRAGSLPDIQGAPGKGDLGSVSHQVLLLQFYVWICIIPAVHWCSRVQWSETGGLILVLVCPWYSLFCLGSCCPWSRAEHWCHHWGHCASVKCHLLLLPGGSLGTGGSVIWGFVKIPSTTYTLLSRGVYFKTSEKGWFVANKWGHWVGSQKEIKPWWSGWGFQGNWLSFLSW